MTLTRILLAACCILGSSCSEPWHAQDDTTPINTTTPGDDCTASPSAWTCQGITKCAAGCGTNLDCVNTCKAKGCSGAQAAFTAVMTCTMKSCLSDCMSGFGAACDKCTAQACKAETDACNSNTCPGGSSGGKCDSPSPSRQDGGSAPAQADGGAAPEASTSKTCATCNDINTCASKCGTDMNCVNACKATACTEAQTAFDAITSCVMGKCLMSCLGGFDDTCNKCASGSCKTEIDACTANTCPASCNGGGSPAPTPSASSTCTQIVSCKQGSFFLDDCASKGCASAQQSFQALDKCVQANCGLSCFLSYGSPFCPGCITQSCAAAWQACQANHC
jgi:hypothetical protein